MQETSYPNYYQYQDKQNTGVCKLSFCEGKYFIFVFLFRLFCGDTRLSVKMWQQGLEWPQDVTFERRQRQSLLTWFLNDFHLETCRKEEERIVSAEMKSCKVPTLQQLSSLPCLSQKQISRPQVSQLACDDMNELLEFIQRC